MTSSRLPGKVLRQLGGQPALDLLLDRLRLAGEVDVIAVLTSDEASDDPIAGHCSSQGVPCHRGPLDDVLTRFAQGATAFGLDGSVRVNGDSPFLDPELVNMGTALFRAGAADVVTNVHPRSFPVGQSVEVIRREALEIAAAEVGDPYQREHVTPFFYERPDRFRIESFSADGDYGGDSLALDTAEDAADFDALIELMDRPPSEYGWREVLDLRRGLTA